MQPEGSHDPAQQRCPQCGSDNPAGAMFCGNCGAQIRTSSFDRPSGPVQLDHTLPAPGADSAQPPRDAAGAAPQQQQWQPAQSSAPHSEWQPAQSAPPQQPVNNPPAPPPVNSPGAGLTPGYGEPPPAQGWQQPAAPDSHNQQAYVPPVYPQTVNQQEFYPSYSATDGNTSGMGEGYPLPPEASGWNWGGFVPYGLFGFFNGNTTYGVLGLVASFLGLYLIYSIVIGATGKQMAWKGRRFDSIQQFEDTMRAWNTWGLVLFIAGIVAVVLYLVFVFIFVLTAESWS